ncbi:MAG: hypothetical protein U9Q79_07810 [Candidatus Hydrogenedentes bacterium]|nr:hypothetical protein [Candidatus Hydrogenedentota bacterium]
MKKRTRVVTGLFVIVVLLSIWVYHLAETKNLERALQPHAEALAQEYASPENRLLEQEVSVESAAGRTIPIIGEKWGKITVYTRSRRLSGEIVYRALEHFYVYEDGQWLMTESGGCTGPECRIRAEKAFEKDAKIPQN